MAEAVPTVNCWHRLSPGLRRCLLERGPLTPRLAALCGAPVRVERLSEHWAALQPAERRLLGLPRGQRARIRQVRLHAGGRPWVYARTVIPVGFLRGEARQLLGLGLRPLGDRLFRLRGIERERMVLRCLPPGAPALQGMPVVPAAGGEPARAACLWARHSVFRLRGRRLSVLEVFLGDPGAAEGPA